MIPMSIWLASLRKRWSDYRYRFVPWIVLNLNNRRVREVHDPLKNNIKPLEALAVLEKYFYVLEKKYSDVIQGILAYQNIMHKVFGFSIIRSHSNVAGTGVFVSSGFIRKGSLVALYPGTVYHAYEPIFFQSIANPFIFRCIDGALIDGKDTGISSKIYRSCGQRDRVGSHSTCDFSWLSDNPFNGLAIGQYVNNETKEMSANVVYQELDIPKNFPLKFLKYIPNANYSFRPFGSETNHVRTVILVALRDIWKGEELFSSYFTLVR